MNKGIFIFILAFATSYVFGSVDNLETRIAVSNIISDSSAVIEVRDLLNKSSVIGDNYFSIKNFIYLNNSFCKFGKDDCAEIDKVFGRLGFRISSGGNLFPICFSNEVDFVFPKNEFPVFNKLANDFHAIQIASMKPAGKEAVDCFPELCKRNYRSISSFRQWQSWMQSFYLSELKKWFRKEGKSFVSVDGHSPLVPYMEGFVTSLNASRLNGVNQCFESIGLTYKVDVSLLPNDKEIEELKYKILNEGFINAKNKEKVLFDLFVTLGIDGYNDFIRQYNGN